MATDRIQRRIEALLDEADAGVASGDWATVRARARAVLAFSPENGDAAEYLAAAERTLDVGQPAALAAPSQQTDPSPAAFVSGRYRVLRLLGSGARKRVYLARDERLAREVAFAVIDATALSAGDRERALREAQAMARVGASPHLVSIFDVGEDGTDIFTVQEFMEGGDVASLLALTLNPAPDFAGEGRKGLPVERTLAIARDVCRALSAIHTAGIVHRDLKPANVFLAADGSARVGDLGLAATAGLDRITQHGTMLGTVAYMPPEQALGGETTPQGDLYSLGCMLYELVTGRPPFTGEDPTAVISQHVNTPPVGPSWLTEHCPPDLETLILHLLGKVPADRPRSAADVLAVLERVDPAQKSASHSGSNELSRVARGVFVGRGPELEKLRKAFDEAFAGRGNLAMLVGEPGIGKTRAAHELETYARMRGATVLWGRAHEASGAPAYWPWVQAGRQWASLNDLATIREEMEQTQGELVRLFPELRNRPGFVEPEPINDPQSAQFRLFDAYVTLVRAMTRGPHPPTPSPAAAGEGEPRGRTLVIVLDDLHWADKPTLLLLQHLARELANMRVLVIGTFRDTDLSRTHPLSEALASLNREAGFQRVVLKGLAKAEVAAYIREAANVVPQPGLIDRIFEETEGNPFFLSEVVNLLTQEGAFSKQSISDIAVPDGVKEALGRRLDRISPETNELLQVCAVAGREFSYDTLTLLGDRDEDTLLKHIEEALAARVIEEMEQPGRYRFTHALMQETLLSELSTTRRVRLHGQVGEALEKRWSDRAGEFASRLATHFLESSTLTAGHEERARRYARLAAEAAEGQFAWAEAVRWYEALTTGAGDPDPEMLTRLARCYEFSDGMGSDRGDVTLKRAIDIYRVRNDAESLARAVAISAFPLHDPRSYIPLVREAIKVGFALGPSLQADLMLRLVLLLYLYSPETPLRELIRLEDELYEKAASDDVAAGRAIQSFVTGRRASRIGSRESGRAYLVAGEEFDRLGRIDDAMSGGYWAAAVASTMLGDLSLAAECGDALARFAAARRNATADWAAANQLGAMALLQWRTDVLERPAYPLIGVGGPTAVFNELRGHPGAGLSTIPDLSLSETDVLKMCNAASAAAAGAGDSARTLGPFQQWARLWRAGVGAEIDRADAFSYIGLCLPQSDDDELCRAVYEEVRHWKNWCGPFSGVGIDPGRGHLALRLGLVDDARQAFNDGLEWAEREGCPVELGRNLQGLAAVAEADGDPGRALVLLDRAAAQYRPRGVKLFLDQVIAAKVRLQGLSSATHTAIDSVAATVREERPDLSSHAAADGTVTLMFSDIEGSTPLNNRLGDAKWLELLHAHNAILDAAVYAHGGRTVKTMGDGYMVAFPSPAAAVDCAVAVQRAFSQPGASASVIAAIRVRIGVHIGAALRDGSDFFGREVNYAARVASAALGGEVLVSEAVKARLGPEHALDAGHEVELKGFEGTHRVYRVNG